MSERPQILCLGEPLVEFIREGVPESGIYRRGIGGDTSNAAIAAARQGASVGYVTALGDDRFGDAVVAAWAEEGIDAHTTIRLPGTQTGVNFIEPDPTARHFTYYRDGSAASRLRPEDLPAEALRGARVLHLSGITLAVSESLRASAFAAIDIIAKAGGIVSLDTNLRLKLWPAEHARAVTARAAERAYIVITSIEDSEILTGHSSAEAICDHYRAVGSEIVIVTCGSEGAYLASGNTRHHIPPAPATAVDSTGAGDSFSGAFLAWWLELDDPSEAAMRAAIVAAGTVSGLGATAPIPRRADVLAHIGQDIPDA